MLKSMELVEEAIKWLRKGSIGGKPEPDRKALSDLCKIARDLKKQEKYDDALMYYYKALTVEGPLGIDDPYTLEIMSDIAEVFRGKKRYEPVSKRNRWAPGRMEKIVRPNHPAMLRLYEKSLACYYQALDRMRKLYGNEHPDTLNVMSDIAGGFYNQKRYGEALNRYHQALSGREEALEEWDTDTLGTINNIASTLSKQGEYGKALKWLHQALDGRVERFEPKHPVTLRTVSGFEAITSKQQSISSADKPPNVDEAYRSPAVMDNPSTTNDIAAAISKQWLTRSVCEPQDGDDETYRFSTVAEKAPEEEHIDTPSTTSEMEIVTSKQQSIYSADESHGDHEAYRLPTVTEKAPEEEHTDNPSTIEHIPAAISQQKLTEPTDELHNDGISPTGALSKTLSIRDIPAYELCSHVPYKVKDCREEIKRRDKLVEKRLPEHIETLHSEPMWRLLEMEDSPFTDEEIAVEQLRRDFDYEEDEDEDEDGGENSTTNSHLYKSMPGFVGIFKGDLPEEKCWEL